MQRLQITHELTLANGYFCDEQIDIGDQYPA